MAQHIERYKVDTLDIAVMRRGPVNSDHVPIVFLHGLGDSSIITFEPIAAHPVMVHYPSLLIDLPGFGYSTAPDTWPATMEHHADAIVTLLDILSIDRTSIVGHSMGASLALMVAARGPSHTSHLILAEPLLKREQSQLAASLSRRSEEEFVSRGFGMLQRATRRQAARGDRAATGFLAPLQHANPTIMHRSATSLLADRSPSFLTLLETLPMERTLLMGARTEGDIGMLPQGVPLIRIPEAGHSMMSENPDAFAHAVADRLNLHKLEGSANVPDAK